MAIGTGAIRAGRAFVELFTDNTKLVRGLRKAENQVRAFSRRVGAIGTSLMRIGAMAMAPLIAAAKVFSSVGDEVAKMSKRTGVSVEALSELRFVASQTGTEFGSLENAFRKMQRSIYDAGRGLSTQVDALADLGLAFKDLDGLAPEEQFKLLADRINEIADPTTKAAIAMSLFGRTGTNLLPMFEQGAAGIDALQRKARELGLTLSKEDAAAAEEFTDKMDAMGKVIKMAVFRIGAALAPALEKAATRITDIAKKAGQWIQQNHKLIVTILKVTAAVLATGVVLVVLGKVAAGVAALIGVVRGLTVAVGFLAAHPMVALLAIAAAVAVAFALLHKKLYATRDAMQKVRQENEQARTASRGHMDALVKLAEKQERNSHEMRVAKGLVAALTERYGDLGIRLDETANKVNGVTEAFKKMVAADLAAEIRDLQADLAEAQNNYDKLRRKMQAYAGPGGMLKATLAGESVEDVEAQAAAAGKRLNAISRRLMMRQEQARKGGLPLPPPGSPPPGGRTDTAGESAFERTHAANLERRRTIAELELRAKFTGVELERKLLDLKEKQAVLAALEAGENFNLVRKEFALRRQMLGVGDAIEQVATRGTFYGAAVAGFGTGDNYAKKTAEGIQEIVANTRGLRNAQGLAFT